MNRQTITMVIAGHLLAVLMVGYISGCSSNQQAGRTRVLIKDEFARNTAPSTPEYIYTAPASIVTYTEVPDIYPAPKPNVSMSIPQSTSESLYTVKKGDTLFSISRRYNVSHKEIARLNNISDPGLIKVGQNLRIPGSEDSTPDTTSSMMAKKAEPKVEKQEKQEKQLVTVKSAPQNYKPVPTSTVRKTTTYAIHTVKRGENLWRIAEKYDVKVDDICELNDITRNSSLASGDRIKIPVN